jgi:hypothetical protein
MHKKLHYWCLSIHMGRSLNLFVTEVSKFISGNQMAFISPAGTAGDLNPHILLPLFYDEPIISLVNKSGLNLCA